MPITLDRSVCCDLDETTSREWLVTNGVGGYAAGTVAGVLTRMEQGLLVALPPNTQSPQLLLAKLDEEVVFDQRTYYLGTNEYRDGTLSPSGFVHLETFRLEAGFPIFTYHLGGLNGIVLEKRIWMQEGRNTTFIQYRALCTSSPEKSSYGANGTRPLSNSRYQDYAEAAQASLGLTLLPLSTNRSHTVCLGTDDHRQFYVQQLRADDGSGDEPATLPRGAAGCMIRAGDYVSPYAILAVGQPESQATFLPTGVWYWNFLRRQDARAGRPATDDLYLPGVIRATLHPGDEALTIIVTAEELSTLNLHPNHLNSSYQRAVEERQQLLRNTLQPQRFFGEGGEAMQAYHLNALPLTTGADPQDEGENYLSTLLLAGDHFLLKHRSPPTEYTANRRTLSNTSKHASALVSEVYTTEQRVRDALIALPGLTLVTGRFDEARSLLRTIGQQLTYGLLPARLSLSGSPLDPTDQPPQAIAADTTLWYFYALDHYLRASHDYTLLHELYPRLVAAIEHYIQGNTNGIALDVHDGLLSAHLPDTALTWMDATIDGIPVTPRSGKPVEVNALWFHALSLMQEWSHYLHNVGTLYHAFSTYEELLTLCHHSFQRRYWYEDGEYLHDVVDGPGGDDAALRPNQLLALSLRFPVLEESYRQRTLEAVTSHLLTARGLRTLSPEEHAYRGRLGESQHEQARALHQGSTWTWLVGPYIDALLAVNTPLSERSSSNTNLCFEYLWRRGSLVLEGFQANFHQGLLGMSDTVFDGDEPHRALSTSPASAPATAELLRAYHTLSRIRTTHSDYAQAFR